MESTGVLKGSRVLGFLLCMGVLLLSAAPAVRGEPRLLNIRHWSAPSCTRVMVDFSDPVAFQIPSASQPSQIVVDVQGSRLVGGERVLNVQDGLVQRVRLAQHPSQGLRVILELKRSGTSHNVFLLPRVDDRPHRLVIDVESAALGQRMQEERRTVQKETGGKARIVVIDPGHGGEDPGALGHRGAVEKDVVLSIAKALQRRLNQAHGIRAFLTRNGDYFLGLKQRAEIAQDYGADLFMSVHADSSPNKGTRGASLYCLSLKGATDEAARILAEKENASDSVGGMLSNNDQDLNTILLDLVQTQTVNDSLKLGEGVLTEVGRVHLVKFSTPRQAGFRVLKAPNIPSVLVEVGFLSNPEEESLLKSNAFQERMAQALEASATRFLSQHGPLKAAPAAQKPAGSPKPKTHVVKTGQSLSQIAALYRTSIIELKRANDLKDASQIRPGQRILIP